MAVRKSYRSWYPFTIALLLLGGSVEWAKAAKCNCENGGDCLPPDNTCNCPYEFAGERCEVDCGCANGGVCSLETFESPEATTNGKTKMPVCSCSDGFIGHKCEVQEATCPDGHKCLYGSTCIRIPNNIPNYHRYTCDCSTVESNQIHIGHNCQHIAATFCNAETRVNHHGFCVNGGACLNIVIDKTKDHQGCTCPQDYEGDHCEYHVDEDKPGDLEGEIGLPDFGTQKAPIDYPHKQNAENKYEPNSNNAGFTTEVETSSPEILDSKKSEETSSGGGLGRNILIVSLGVCGVFFVAGGLYHMRQQNENSTPDDTFDEFEIGANSPNIL
eukprot:scaffold48006_cov51-Attheya_sp.AAC.2